MKTIIDTVAKGQPVVPVIVVDHPEDIIGIAEKALAANLSTLEITLRTDAAYDAIKLAKQEFPQLATSAGTVITPQQLDRVQALGVDFVVSPGITPTMIDCVKANDIPWLPGVATSSDVMLALEVGFYLMKFFPAEANGGVKALKSISAPFPQAKFCPTGGVSAANYHEYLALEGVPFVGGTWLLK